MSIHDRGFKHMNPEQIRVIARLGGQAAAKSGKAHKWTKTTAKLAGRLGGLAGQAARRLRVEEQRLDAIARQLP